MTSSSRSALKTCCAIAATAALLMPPPGAHAAPITNSVLAETPLQGLNLVKPNIMLTVDDSGSMAWDFLPDFTAFAGPGVTHCRDTATQCGGLPINDTFLFNGFVASRNDPPIRSSAQNRQYYDPTATYDVGRRENGNALPYESATPDTWTSVFVNGFAGYPGANNGGTINLTTAYPDTVWCTKASPSAAEILTADSTGSVCRRNGYGYVAVAVGSNTTLAVAPGYNYPNASDKCASKTVCVFSNPATLNGSPYYYSISQVQYCSAKDGAGWGTGSCQSQYTATTFKYVRYGTGASTFDPQAFTRIDIKPSSFLVNGLPAANPSGRTYLEEMRNFAKWYTFYRTRILAMKTATGSAFSALSEADARVGLHTLRFGLNFSNNAYIANGNTNNNAFLNILDFNAANKSVWFTELYKINVGFGTPLPDAVWRIGELYSGNLAATGLPGAKDPLDPITGVCQPNYHLLSTDGYWNYALNRSIGDRDRTVPGSLPGAIPGFTPGAPFPRPYYEGPTVTNDSVADLAMDYWIRDLRPGLDNRVKDTIAPWQHVTLYGLSIGAQGNLPYPGGIDDVTSGARNWPTTLSGSPSQFLSAAGPEAIDDLWHAAINSRGKYFNAGNPQQLAESIVRALYDFTAGQAGTGTAIGITSAQLSSTKNYGYLTSYTPGDWSGDVRKFALDPGTGALPVDASGNPKDLPLWSAATQLDAQAAVAGGVKGWDTNRRIVTITGGTGTGVPFRLDKLAKFQKDSLANAWPAVPSNEQRVLDFLRGDKSNEGTGATNFRARSRILGDIVYSGAVPVGAPSQGYTDAGYADFATARKSRTPMVYVGANDAMMHAFDDSANADGSPTANAGRETWAYISKTLFTAGDPNDSDHKPSPEFQIGALSYRPGALLPTFDHKFYVNATPRIWDIDFANTNTSNPPQSGNAWRTLLVGTLGVGGQAVYALDVTDPVKFTDTEAAAATRVLWEVNSDSAGFENLGYVFDAPTLVKTIRYGWVVLIASGYNNKDGKGRLYVVNPPDGRLLKTLSTEVGNATDPSGLSTIRAYTPSRKDPYVLQAYGGDLKGNVWRFDLSDPDESKWKVELIAKLTDKNGRAQPITTGVRIEIDQNNNVDRYLFVGTGKLLHQQDLADASVTNALYVIRDGTRTAAEAAPATPYSRADLNPVSGATIAGFSGTATRGWYQDASDPKEKIVTDVHADVQTVVYSFSKPSQDPCEVGLTSTLFARNLNTGNSILQSAAGGIVASITDIGAIAGVRLIQTPGGSSGSSGNVRVQVTTMKGQVFTFGVELPPGATLRHRVSWRLLNRD